MYNLIYIENEFARGYISAKNADFVQVSLEVIDICNGYLHDALLFSRLIYWHSPNKETGKTRMQVNYDGHLWVAKNHADWYEECRVKSTTVRKSLNRLQDTGLIFYELHGFAGKPTPYIRINWDVFESKIKELNSTPSDTSGQNDLIHDNTPSDTSGQNDLIQQVISNTETTTKTTSKTTTKKKKKKKKRAQREGKPSDSGSKIDEELEHQEQLQKDIAARTNAYLGIYWGRVTKRQQKPPVTKDRFRQGRYKDMEAVASHDLAITPAEFAKYLDDYIDSNPFFEKNPTAMPRVETIAQQIHVAVDLMRKELYGGVSYGTPINTSESGDNEDNSDERYGKSRF